MDTGILPIADRSTLATPQSLDSLAVGTPSSSTNLSSPSSAISSPDVRVDLSAAGRQMAMEMLERETVQSSQQSEAFNAEISQNERSRNESFRSEDINNERYENAGNAQISRSQTDNDQTLNIGTQEELRLESGQVRPEPQEEITRTEERREPEPERRAEERPEEVVQPVQASPTNTSRSASVVTQYNISPESALGQSISTQA
ncbi:hypothetical protein MED121_11354 [Marinomonas sp. MED121]|uniref:hypothetical protein n=1 Tax=Marinomonas sp. MED121 TaxID=314277 RepID=UPI0000690C0F|nr:hypothetical protein [Marinomonas sp. MED121]EAQ64957.1 hypothetical protein MED121_11354 [Marinomonas sp. MED121]